MMYKKGRARVRKTSMGAATASDPFSLLQRERFRDQLAQNHVQEGDDSEGQNDGDGVRVDVGVRNRPEQLLHDACQHGFADPAQRQAGERNAKLDAVYDLIEVLMQPLHSAGADPMGLNQLLDASIA